MLVKTKEEIAKRTKKISEKRKISETEVFKNKKEKEKETKKEHLLKMETKRKKN